MNNKKDEEDIVVKEKKYFSWLREFSKKIVTVTFLIFVAIHIYTLIMYAIEYKATGSMSDISTLLIETHTTFRDVIGGYIVKAACENTIKILGSVIDIYMKNKYSQSDDCDGERSGDF